MYGLFRSGTDTRFGVAGTAAVGIWRAAQVPPLQILGRWALISELAGSLYRFFVRYGID